MITKLSLNLAKMSLLIVSALCVLGSCSWVGQQERQAKYFEQLKAKYGNSVPVVYVIKDINKGEIISADAVEERQVDLSKVAYDFSISVKRVIGRKATCHIPAHTVMADFEACGPLAAEPGKGTTLVNRKPTEVDNIRDRKKLIIEAHRHVLNAAK
jgi:flagella basal body P-ring formation protein FlgA